MDILFHDLLLTAMPETDHALLTAFSRDRCELAFRTLVERHLPVVWSCARRVTNGDHALAQDVAQLVFTDLAAKARTIPATMPLGGWLHRHTFFTATKAVRTEARRRERETRAATTAAMSDLPADAFPADDPDAVWAQLAPHLDAELAALSPDDRAALVLRFFEKRSHRSVATLLGISEEAARKRIDRALEKLRDRLGKKGISLASGATLAALLPQAIVAPPAGLAAGVAASALSAATAGTVATLSSATTSLTHAIATTYHKLGSPAAAIGAAAGLAVLAGGWFWWANHAANTINATADSHPAPRRPAPLSAVALSPAEYLPPLHATAFLVPDSLVAGRLLVAQAELDEAALYALVADTATRGGGEVISTRPVRPSVHREGSTPKVVEASAVENHTFPTEFDYGRTGKAVPTAFDSRTVGTRLNVHGSPPGQGGRHLVTFSFEHHLAAPGETRWSGNLADPEAEHPSRISYPQFHPVSFAGQVSIAPGETRLGGAIRIPPGVNPKSPTSAQRMLVFITLDPKASQ